MDLDGGGDLVVGGLRLRSRRAGVVPHAVRLGHPAFLPPDGHAGGQPLDGGRRETGAHVVLGNGLEQRPKHVVRVVPFACPQLLRPCSVQHRRDRGPRHPQRHGLDQLGVGTFVLVGRPHAHLGGPNPRPRSTPRRDEPALATSRATASRRRAGAGLPAAVFRRVRHRRGDPRVDREGGGPVRAHHGEFGQQV